MRVSCLLIFLPIIVCLEFSVQGAVTGSKFDANEFWYKNNNWARFENYIRLSEKNREIRPLKAIEYSADALKIARIEADPEKITEALIASAWDHYFAYRNRDVLQFCYQAEKEVAKIDECKINKFKAKIDRIYASVFLELGLYDRSLMFFSKVLPFMVEGNNQTEACEVLMQVGVVYFRKGDLEKYNFYNQLALELSMKTGNFHIMAIILRDLGIGRLRSGKTAEAEDFFNRAIGYSRLSKDSAFYSFIAYNKGVYFREKGLRDSSIFQLKLSVNEFKKLNNRKMIGFSLAEISYVFLDNEVNDSAAFYYHLAQNVDAQSESPRLHQRILELGIDLYRHQNLYEKALALSIENKSYSDSMINVREADRSGAFEKLYMSEQEYYETLKENDHIRQAQRFYILFSFLVLMVIGVVVYFVLVYFRRKMHYQKLEKQKAEENVDQKNKELTIEMMNSLKKKELFLKIEQSLDQLLPCESSEMLQGRINSLKTEIKRESSSDVWKEFEKRFSDVHTGYLERLLKKYPKLTPNEIKLCAFLKLNLSSKQIGELTGQQISAIELSRIRLRKKLGIANTKINLVAFLSGF